MLEQFIVLVYLGFATSAVSLTLTKSGAMKPLREWLKRRAGSTFMLSCPFCTSFYIAAPLTIVYRPVVVQSALGFDIAVSMFAVIGIAAVISGVVIHTFPHFRKES
jgi:hypothetical protein